MAGFPRQARLLTASQYQRVFQQPTKLIGPDLILFSRRNNLGWARLGLAVSKRHARRAVDRNRIKRVARTSFRLRQQQLPAIDIVVMIRPGAAERTNHQLRDSLDKLWDKLIQHG